MSPKQLKPIILVITLFILFSCSNTQPSDYSTQKNITTDSSISVAEKVVVHFLEWYRDNGTHLADSLVLNAGRREWDSTKFYAVNFPATEQYLANLERTGMISPKYSNNWRKYFLKQEQNFKDNPANDGPPEGFDYDLILFSQENPGLDQIRKSKISSKRNKDSTVEVKITTPMDCSYFYTMSLSKGKWFIEDIRPNYE